MNKQLFQTFALALPFFLSANSAWAGKSDLGVKTTAPKGVGLLITEVTHTGDPEGTSASYHEQELKGSAYDVPGTDDDDQNVYSDSESYSVTYDVEATAVLSGGSYLEARGVAGVSGNVKVSMKDNHGIAAGIAHSKAVATVGGLTVEKEGTTGAAITETGSHNSSGNFIFAGFGAGGSVNVTQAGTTAKVETYADSGATAWVKASSGVVSASWHSAIHLETERPTQNPQPQKATAEAETLAYALGEIRFRIVTPTPAPDGDVPGGTPNPDSGGGNGGGNGGGSTTGQN